MVYQVDRFSNEINVVQNPKIRKFYWQSIHHLQPVQSCYASSRCFSGTPLRQMSECNGSGRGNDFTETILVGR